MNASYSHVPWHISSIDIRMDGNMHAHALLLIAMNHDNDQFDDTRAMLRILWVQDV